MGWEAEGCRGRTSCRGAHPRVSRLRASMHLETAGVFQADQDWLPCVRSLGTDRSARRHGLVSGDPPSNRMIDRRLRKSVPLRLRWCDPVPVRNRERIDSNHPKPIGSIDLELPLEEDRKNIYLHIFEQLLMIFVDGLKYFFSDDNNKVRLTDLTEDNIQKLNDYFHSMNYHITIEIYPTIFEYQFRYPNYFKDQSLIDEKVQLEDFFYETYDG